MMLKNFINISGFGLRFTGHLFIHRSPIQLQILHLPKNREVSLSHVDDGPNGDNISDSYGHDGTLRGRVSSFESTIALYLRKGDNRAFCQRPCVGYL